MKEIVKDYLRNFVEGNSILRAKAIIVSPINEMKIFEYCSNDNIIVDAKNVGSFIGK